MSDAGEGPGGDVMTRRAEAIECGKGGGRFNGLIIGANGFEQWRVYCRERRSRVIVDHVGKGREFSGVFDVRIHDARRKFRMEIRELRESLLQ